MQIDFRAPERRSPLLATRSPKSPLLEGLFISVLEFWLPTPLRHPPLPQKQPAICARKTPHHEWIMVRRYSFSLRKSPTGTACGVRAALAEGGHGGPGGFAPWRVQGSALPVGDAPAASSRRRPPPKPPKAYLLAFSQKSGHSSSSFRMALPRWERLFLTSGSSSATCRPSSGSMTMTS